MTRLLSQFVLSRYALHKLRQLRLAGEAYVSSTLRALRNKYSSECSLLEVDKMKIIELNILVACFALININNCFTFSKDSSRNFINTDIGIKNISDTFQLSPNKKYKAFINEGQFQQDCLYITNENDIVIYSFHWNEMINSFQESDTMEIIGWSSDSDTLWFWSITPTTCGYFAKININEQKTTFYSTINQISSSLADYTIDVNQGIIFFSDAYKVYDFDMKEKIQNRNIFSLQI